MTSDTETCQPVDAATALHALYTTGAFNPAHSAAYVQLGMAHLDRCLASATPLSSIEDIEAAEVYAREALTSAPDDWSANMLLSASDVG